MRKRSFLGALALAPAIGVAMGLSFPPYDFWPLSIVSLIALFSVTLRLPVKQVAVIWWVSGGAFFLFLLDWLRVVGVDAWIAASLALALWWIVAGICVVLVKGLPLAPIWIGSVVTTVEILKSRWPWDGFPWGQLAFPLSEGYLGAYLPYVASLGLGWVGATLAACLAWMFRPRSLRPKGRRLSWAWVVLTLLVLPFLLMLDRPTNSTEGTLGVAMIQGNVPEVGLDFNARRLAIVRNHLNLTNELLKSSQQEKAGTVGEQLDLIIWPENASDIDPLADAVINTEISRLADRADIPILVGAVIQDPENREQVLNAGILWKPQLGPTQTYIKQNPVMFGEFVPFRSLLTRFIGRFDRVPRDFGKGDTPGVFDLEGKKIGDVICFEIANDAVVRNTVREGAQVLVVQTNNATYNLLGQTEQQLQIGRVRAKEFNRYVLVAALSGISAVVNDRGVVLEEAGEYQSAIIKAQVPLNSSQTLSAKFGHSITLLIFLLGVVAVLAAGVGMLQKRRR